MSDISSWQVQLVVLLIGTGGLTSLAITLIQLSKPSRLRTEVESSSKIIPLLKEGSVERQSLELAQRLSIVELAALKLVPRFRWATFYFTVTGALSIAIAVAGFVSAIRRIRSGGELEIALLWSSSLMLAVGVLSFLVAFWLASLDSQLMRKVVDRLLASTTQPNMLSFYNTYPDSVRVGDPPNVDSPGRRRHSRGWR